MNIRQPARVSDQERSSLDARDVLAEFADVVSDGTSSVAKLLPSLARLARKVIDYELFAVLLRVRGTPYLQVSFATGHGEKQLRNRRVRIGRGITGSAAASRRTVVVNDVRRDPRYIPAVNDVVAEMAVPLLAQGRLIGVIDFQSTRAGAFGSVQRSLLRVIAARLAVVLDAARMLEETAGWNRKLRALLKVSHSFSTILNLKELLKQVAAAMHRLIRYDALSILLLDAEAGMLRPYLSVRHDERVGIGDVPLSQGIIGAAARSATPLRSTDTRRDRRYLPVIEGIRSELAVPLMVRDKVVAVLDLESENPGFFTRDHMRTLSLLAPHLGASIENARLYQEVAGHKDRLTGDLAMARELQQSLLGVAPQFPGIEVSACNIPAAAVSGDFYDFLSFEPDMLRIFLGDVSGKGAAAALFAALTSGAVRDLSFSDQPPSTMLAAVNKSLVSRNVSRRYVAATVVDWLPGSNCLRLSNAGAGDLVLVRAGQPETLRIEGLPLGLFATAGYEEMSLPVRPGDILVMASDGITECENRSGCDYGAARLAETVVAHRCMDARGILNNILESIREHAAGAAQQDDQTTIVVKIQDR